MKKIILSFLGCLMMAVLSFGQASFSDDFESYTPGDWLGTSAPEWTTWSGNTGGGDDVTVSDEDAASGSNSIKLGPATGNGGPEDVVLFFTGDKFTTGNLDMNLNMKVKTSAYFNYQQEVTIGTTWAMNAIFDANGAGSITGSDNLPIMTFSYPMDEWFNFRMVTNLDANKWQVFVDDNCVGSFANNTSNGIASIDIFPRGGDEFFVDDFSYEYVLEAPVIVNDARASLKLSEDKGLVGTTTAIGGIFTNVGTSMITEFSLEVNVGGATTPVSMDNLNLASGEFMTFSIDENFSMPEGDTDVSIAILSVNGGTFDDEDVCNDGETRRINAVAPAPHKKILVEEATGTWCGWCPRGTVSMERLTYKYPDHFIGIAVHSGDPMENDVYGPGLGATGFPDSKVDRMDWVDPGFESLEPAVLAQAQVPVIATLLNGAAWDATTRELQISLSVNALDEISTDYKINIALTEDDVTGTGNEWAQVNYYSSAVNDIDLYDINGVNWSELPDPVTGLDYDHVARAILAPFEGLEDSFTETLEDGGVKIFTFTYTIPEDFNEDNMHIVSMIINPDESINNAESVTITEAVANGIASSTHDIALNNATNIYPNPFSNTTTVSMNMAQTSDVLIEVIDASGRLVMVKEYQKQSGFFNITFDGSSLNTGMYVMKITANDKFASKRISIIR